MAPSEKQPFYDPIPPTYDEAVASGSHYVRSSIDDRDANETESQSLLNRSTGAPSSSSRRPDGYHPPTVESDDSDIEGLLDSETDDDEAAQVRREMQEMDIEEPSSSRGRLWGKRIGFSLPTWKWSWRPTLPRIPLPRLRIQLPSQSATTGGGESDGDETRTETRWQWNLPKVNGMIAIIVFARLLAAFIVLGFVYLVFASDFFNSWGGRMGTGFRFNADDLRIHILNNVDPARLRASVQHFSSYAHIAGTEGDYATAMDMESMFSRAGLDEVGLDEYIAYINYPTQDGRAIQILDDKGDKAIWTAKLEEEERNEATAGRQTWAFHGHSKSGDVRGPLIYANYGSREDFKRLQDNGVKTAGAIALVRYYGTQSDEALKVKAAELAGFAGCIIYSDPADYGSDGGEVGPSGRFMPADGVQRGSVSLSSYVLGDVLTPGWGSKEGKPRMKVDQAPGLVGIPSLPLAWRDAQVLLQHLKGHGEKVPEGWRGAVPDVKEWWTGDEKSPIVRLKNEQDVSEKQPIWNVYGKIVGMEQTAKSIIIGNHRDSWAFGATDPHTGTAVMVEMARIFGDLLMRGWRPLRSIEFMSWDGEEYNMIGSTEYVEDNVDALREHAYAYINLDNAVSGTEFHAAGSPLLGKTLLHALNRIADPNMNATLKDLWDERGAKLEGLGAGSDYVGFQDIAGVSSIDIGFRGERYPYRSSYDTFDLVEQVVDPDFTYHGLMAQVVGLLILDLADSAVLPLDVSAYGTALERWAIDLEQWAEKHTEDGIKLNFKELKDAVASVQKMATEFTKWKGDWDHAILQTAGWEGAQQGADRLRYNNIVGNFDAALLDLDGGVRLISTIISLLSLRNMLTQLLQIPDRTQFKHIVFGPQRWSSLDGAIFPAIRDSIEDKNWEQAKKSIHKASAILRKAATKLSLDAQEDGS
ncbi:Glutamate carboxypeptidase-like protein [Hapsidospora chrysogenum ATCC 11550]|uniref:Glutamate carboxypeptidase-like protein n=1 Tax=Hapsidospora chrysogenum (strain ATCC 11550 / CBS 779.69 / DSM 880 / IAM 14645 / JCM 23072 / IMI 49137) TaxID=857340 RepID=A0A086T0F8_HAPC1|nr:Glutamate carboxypeptidase-like protein [Hapsidospora chrysogenum ATCC 11550]